MRSCHTQSQPSLFSAHLRSLLRYWQLKKRSLNEFIPALIVCTFTSGCVTSNKNPQAIWEQDAKPQHLLAEGAGEGPAWHPDWGLLFSGHGHIQRWEPDIGLTVFREKAGTNGLLFDHHGRLLACEPQQR